MATETDWTAEELASLERLPLYNGGDWDATTNPYGFGEDGYLYNQMRQSNDAGIVGRGARRMALYASTQAIAAAQSADSALAERQAAQNAATNSYNSAQDAAGSETRARSEADRAGAFASGLNLPAVTAANAFQFLQVKPDGSGYRTVEIPPIPPLLPITMTAPASGATDVGAGGTYTFVARAFVGDTIGFYSNYGVPVASRFVNVYEPGGANPVKTFTATGGGPSLVANFTGSGLVVSHTYQFEFGYTDVQGNTVKSPKVSATTASQFKAAVGQAFQGGFLAFENFGDGDLFDLVVASKSTEASKVWDTQSQGLMGYLSRTNGKQVNEGLNRSYFPAIGYCLDLVSGGKDDWYLGAIDELRAISSKLKPSVAVEAAFKAGGAQVYDSVSSWSSTETTASNAMSTTMVNGGFSEDGKTTSYLVRAIKRVSTFAPYPIGTAMEGGYLAAYLTDLSSGSPVTYMLIVADKATEVTRAYDGGNNGSLGSTMALSRTNGQTISEDSYVKSRGGFQAFNYCNSLVSGGKTDWYLGAIDEMLAIARMNSQLPSGQRIVASTPYWASTEIDASNAKYVFVNGSGVASEDAVAKSSSQLVRPIRRVLLPAT